MVSLQLVQEFLAQKRFAFVGASRQPKDFSRALFREFLTRGYQPVPVNPARREIEGLACACSLLQIDPPVDTVLFMTPPATTDRLLQDCAETGVRRVWIYRASPAAVKFCRDNGIAIVHDECPFMFWQDSAWYHRFHGFVKKIGGSYPA
jgi:predicted CoA-binding protein